MKNSHFVALFLFLTTIGLLSGSTSSTASQNPQRQVLSKLSNWVLDSTANGEESEFLVVLNDQADLRGAELLQSKEDKGRFVFNALQARAQATQRPILDWLIEHKRKHQSFYIVNAILVTGTRETALELASRAEVVRVDGNPQLHGIQPIIPIESDALNLSASPQVIEPGVSYIRAPEVWAAGFTGQGIVIGGQDTGVQWDHPALLARYRGWDGVRVNHDYNWHDSVHAGGGVCGPNTKTPCDDDNHGTHTLGSALGSDGGANQIGVAPGAKFIACRNMDRGNGTPATYLECFQFLLAPYPLNGTSSQGDPRKAPDISTNSWSCPPSEGCEPNTLKTAIEAHRAAGIMTIVAAGNNGLRGCASVADPPGLYDGSYSVGAIDVATGNIASFSSRGPVTIDGSNRIKPDITAPGVAVRSAIRNGGYAVFNGTSMATPHVAGATALLWSAHPDIRGQIDVTENILNESAVRVQVSDCNSNGFPNNVYGFGRLDVKAAFDLAATKLSPSQQVFGIRGGEGKVEVTALPNVKWRGMSNNPWITITSGNNGVVEGIGNGVVHFLVATNTSPDLRSGTLVIAGRKVTITQPGAAPLYAVSGRASSNSGMGIGNVTLTFERVAGGGDVPEAVETDENGNWSQSGFEPGTTYRVTASRTRTTFSPASHDFNAANTTLDFVSVERRIIISR